MFRGLGSLALLLAAIGPVSAQNVPAEEAKEGFVSMFNGKDFTGWRFDASSAVPEKLPANWKVEDGVIKLAGGGKPHCGSQWDYEDFDLRLEWRAMRANYNSGLYIRSGRNVGANQINLAKGGEGGFIGGKIKGAKTVPTLQKPFMEWNHWRVLAVGDKVTFWCNDQLAWEGTELKDLRGYVGLQAEGGAIEFRNLRIKELGYDSLSDLKSWAGAEARWKKEADGTLVAGAGRRWPPTARTSRTLPWPGMAGGEGHGRGLAARRREGGGFVRRRGGRLRRSGGCQGETGQGCRRAAGPVELP